MITRTWDAEVPAKHADGFEKHLLTTGIADIVTMPGCCGAQILRRDRNDVAEFRLVTYWDSLEAIRAYSGTDGDDAVLYDGDDEYEFSPSRTVDHHRIVYSTGDLP